MVHSLPHPRHCMSESEWMNVSSQPASTWFKLLLTFCHVGVLIACERSLLWLWCPVPVVDPNECAWLVWPSCSGLVVLPQRSMFKLTYQSHAWWSNYFICSMSHGLGEHPVEYPQTGFSTSLTSRSSTCMVLANPQSKNEKTLYCMTVCHNGQGCLAQRHNAVLFEHDTAVLLTVNTVFQNDYWYVVPANVTCMVQGKIKNLSGSKITVHAVNSVIMIFFQHSTYFRSVILVWSKPPNEGSGVQ